MTGDGVPRKVFLLPCSLMIPHESHISPFSKGLCVFSLGPGRKDREGLGPLWQMRKLGKAQLNSASGHLLQAFMPSVSQVLGAPNCLQAGNVTQLSR